MLCSVLSTFCKGQFALPVFPLLCLKIHITRAHFLGDLKYFSNLGLAGLDSPFFCIITFGYTQEKRRCAKMNAFKIVSDLKESCFCFSVDFNVWIKLRPLILSSDLLSSSSLLISDALFSCRCHSEVSNLSLALKWIFSVILYSNTALGICPVKGKIKRIFVFCVFAINVLHIARVTREYLDPPNNHLKTTLNLNQNLWLRSVKL